MDNSEVWFWKYCCDYIDKKEHQKGKKARKKEDESWLAIVCASIVGDRYGSSCWTQGMVYVLFVLLFVMFIFCPKSFLIISFSSFLQNQLVVNVVEQIRGSSEVHFVFVLDGSGSIPPSDWGLMKHTLSNLITNGVSSENIKGSLIVFSDDARVIFQVIH